MSQPLFPLPVLLADVGGTNTRFSLVTQSDDLHALENFHRVNTADFPSLESAASAVVVKNGWPSPQSIVVAAAGPVNRRCAKLTNAGWHINGDDVAAALGLQQGLLLNDFETLSIALSILNIEQDVLTIGEARAPSGATRVVIGAGTGIGVGALIEVEDRFLPIPSEAGHIAFLPLTSEERLFWDAFAFTGKRPQAELMLSGPALSKLYDAEKRCSGLHDDETLSPEAILKSANANENVFSRRAVERHLALMARFASDVAIAFMTTGGIFLGGGVLPRMRAQLNPLRFREIFEDNASHAQILKNIPIYLITLPEPTVYALKAVALQPESYMLSYSERLWRSSSSPRKNSP